NTEVVFEAPVEYQNVGALTFYAKRRITMLEPSAGYTRPGYLESWQGELFIGRDELERRWESGRPVALVSDPQSPRENAEGLVSAGYHVVERFGDRWVLTNSPVIVAR